MMYKIYNKKTKATFIYDELDFLMMFAYPMRSAVQAKMKLGEDYDSEYYHITESNEIK